MDGCGLFLEGIYAGSAERPYKEGKPDGYNVMVVDGKGASWRVKVAAPVPAQFGDSIRIKMENVNTYKDRIYYSGVVVPCYSGTDSSV